MAPTYREVANIGSLVRAVHAVLTPLGFDWELLFVDDDSGDGSEEAALDLARQYPVRFETRRAAQRDLSMSVLQGLKSARFDTIVVMDADLSHPPASIPNLLEALDGGAMVMGSRYTPGGSLHRNWSRRRRVISRAATLLAKPLAKCADPMSGFFAVDRRRLPDFMLLHPLGYKIGLELMVRGRLEVKEVPIAFRDRSEGSSKLTWNQQLKFLRHLSRLYRFRYPLLTRLGCFGLVGASGFAVDIACWQGLQLIGLEHRWARFLSFWPAVTWNWRWNRAITFKDRPAAPLARQWVQFMASSQVGLVTNVGAYIALTGTIAFFDRYRILALVAGVLVGMAANFAVADRFVFRAGRLEQREKFSAKQS